MARPNQSIGKRSGGSSMKRRQWPTINFPHGIQFIFKDYSYDEFVTRSPIGNFNTTGNAGEGQTIWRGGAERNTRAQETGSFVLELPIPKTLTDSTGVSIAGFERGFIESFLTTQGAALANDPMGAASKIANAISKASGNVAGANFDEIFGGEKGSGDTFKRLVLTLGTSVLGQLGLGEKSIAAVGGSVQNPQSTLYFDGVDLRSFSFAWQLYPANKAEADEIKNIVREVKSKILPRVQGLNTKDKETQGITGSSLGRAFLKYPSVVLINLLGVDESHYLKFKPCMCKGINIDYSDGGMLTIAEGGVPYGISLSMDFMELEIQTAEDYGADSADDIELALIPEQEGEADTND